MHLAMWLKGLRNFSNPPAAFNEDDLLDMLCPTGRVCIMYRNARPATAVIIFTHELNTRATTQIDSSLQPYSNP